MEDQQLNVLIKKIIRMKDQSSESEKNDPIYLQTLTMHLSLLNARYGIFLNEMLFELYDEYCAEGEIEQLENYLSPKGVAFALPDQPGTTYALKLKAFPVRFVIEQDNETRSLKVA